MNRNIRVLFFGLFLLVMAAGCAAPIQNQPTATPSVRSTLPAAAPTTAEQTVPPPTNGSPVGSCSPYTTCLDEQSAVRAATAGVDPTAEAAAPHSSATPDLRLDPAGWREWPVVPERVSDFARQVYRKGLAMGNDPRRFSKIGDCQAIREVLMGVYDKPGQYRLPEDQPYLSETIEQFAGSFNRDGQGVKGGFNAAAVLSPLWADPQACLPGETPMECEYRTYKPSIVIISLEVWWDGRTPDRYVEYMRRIIEYYLENGVVPVLSTKADNVEGDHAINLATAELAYDYDLPLWNWWRAAQSLPNRGLDPNRPDGFHLSYAAWTPRGRTALQSLDAVWRMLNDQSVPVDQPVETAVPSPTPTVTPAQFQDPVLRLEMDTAALQPVGSEPASRLLIGVTEREGEERNPAGAVTIDRESGQVTRMLSGGHALVDAAPNGDYLLASRLNDLYLQDEAGERTLLSDSLLNPSPAPARWLPESGGIAFLEVTVDSERALVLLPFDGASRRALDTGPLTAGSVVGGTAEGVYWLEDCGVDCDPDGLWFSPLDGSPVQEVGTFRRPQLSPDGVTLSYLTADNRLGLRNLQTGAERTLSLTGDAWIDFVWSPDGAWLSVLKAERSDYSGRLFGNLHWLVNAQSLTTVQLPDLEGLNARLTYAPDGTIYRAATLEAGDGYRVSIDVVDPTTRKVTSLNVDLTGEDFLWVASWGAY